MWIRVYVGIWRVHKRKFVQIIETFKTYNLISFFVAHRINYSESELTSEYHIVIKYSNEFEVNRIDHDDYL